MLTKGSQEYKKAQELANQIQNWADTERMHVTSFHNASIELGCLIHNIKKTDTFAAKIAETIEKSMNPYSYILARVSSKQAWVLACAAVELNINF